MIKVHLEDRSAEKKGGLLGWMTGRSDRQASAVQTARGTEIELRMERRDPAQPSKLTITLIMRPRGVITADWKARCTTITPRPAGVPDGR
ncbi:MAG: hypothetical protein U0736_03500 [Gemmataceae bacterium]